MVATFPGAAQATSTTCATTVVCAEYINTSSGVAIHGEANSGIGIRGTSVTNTGFYGASGSGSAGAPGVEGESTKSTGNDAAGAFGLAFLSGKGAPAYGAIAYGSSYGIFGEAANAGTSSGGPGYGVFGLDNGGTASSAGDYNAGVFGSSIAGTGVLAEANGTPQDGFYGRAPVGVYSVANTASGAPLPEAWAFLGETNAFGVGVFNASTSTSAYLISPGYFVEGVNNYAVFYSVDTSGNERLHGTLTTSKGTYVRTMGASGTAMMEYSDRTTAPQVEDVGEGQLANGRAYVSIDARLADTIDRRIAYHVFVTPEGDCNGLYVTQKSATGFVVRELRGGRSSLAFEYRIVAKPLDENGKRLALAPQEDTHATAVPAGRETRRAIAAALSPEERLRQRIGARAYADAMAHVRQRLNPLR
jgi:hypothetical protein